MDVGDVGDDSGGVFWYSEGVSSLGACIINHRAQRNLKQHFLGVGSPSLKAQQVFFFPVNDFSG